MRRVIVTAILGAFLVAAPHLFATQEQGRSASLERAFPQHGRIRMDLSAGDYEISGGAANRIRVQWSVWDADRLPKVKANLDVRDRNATITTAGPSSKGLKVIIQVPERSDLYVRLTAGDLRLEDIRGNNAVASARSTGAATGPTGCTRS